MAPTWAVPGLFLQIEVQFASYTFVVVVVVLHDGKKETDQQMTSNDGFNNVTIIRRTIAV